MLAIIEGSWLRVHPCWLSFQFPILLTFFVNAFEEAIMVFCFLFYFNNLCLNLCGSFGSFSVLVCLQSCQLGENFLITAAAAATWTSTLHFTATWGSLFLATSFCFRPASDLVQLSNCCCCCFIFYIYTFPLFGYFASLSRSNTCQPRKSSRKKKCALNLKNGRRKPERATNQFYDKASPVPHFLASFRNSEFKYQIFTVMGNSSIGGAKKEYQLLLPRTPAIYCLPVQTPYTVFTFYSPFWY